MGASDGETVVANLSGRPGPRPLTSFPRCSLGAAFEARHHPTFTTFPKSLADFFADRAKTLVEIELDSPCIATVQALVLLSSHDIGCRRDSRGWLYSGVFPPKPRSDILLAMLITRRHGHSSRFPPSTAPRHGLIRFFQVYNPGGSRSAPGYLLGRVHGRPVSVLPCAPFQVI